MDQDKVVYPILWQNHTFTVYAANMQPEML